MDGGLLHGKERWVNRSDAGLKCFFVRGSTSLFFLAWTLLIFWVHLLLAASCFDL